MSYFSNYENNSKIPYDDIPISRNEKSSRGGIIGGFENRNHSRKRSSPSVFLTIMVILNLVLSVTCLYFIKTTKKRTVNQYVIEMSSNSEVSSAAKASAYLNSVCVAAGGICNSESSFYNSTNSRGSGVVYKVIDNTIYFVTCYHVVSGYESKIWVLLPTQLIPIQVSLVAYSAHYDIAVLKYQTADVEYTLAGCSPISVYDSVYVSMGEKVFAVGNSLSNGLSITDGVLSHINVLIKVGSNSFSTRAIQTSTEINPGNSGGGLFNASGKFVGLVSAKRHTATSGSETVTVAGTSYAIPSSLVCGIADKIIMNNGKPTYINLGASFTHDASLGKGIEYVEYGGQNRQIEKYTVVVESVSYGSISSGKLSSGDEIVSMDFYTYDSGSEMVHVDMYNKFIFDDYSFSIREGSKIKFGIGNGSGTITRYVEITATSISTVSD